MNPYKFISSRPANVANNTNAPVADLDPILDVMEASRCERRKAPYEFVYHEGLTKDTIEHASVVQLTMGSYDDGTSNNRIEVTYDDGTGRQFRVYGSEKQVLPPKTFTAEEIANLKFGYCTSAGVVMTTKSRGANREIVTLYCNIA